MELPKYPLTADPSFQVFTFTSTGPKGHIKKIIKFDLLDAAEKTFHLGFGDLDETAGRVNYWSVDNNGDTELILATVISAIYLFFSKNPGFIIFAKGTTPSRNRLYRMMISRFMKYFESDLEILIDNNGVWIPFRQEVPSEAFMIKEK